MPHNTPPILLDFSLKISCPITRDPLSQLECSPVALHWFQIRAGTLLSLSRMAIHDLFRIFDSSFPHTCAPTQQCSWSRDSLPPPTTYCPFVLMHAAQSPFPRFFVSSLSMPVWHASFGVLSFSSFRLSPPLGWAMASSAVQLTPPSEEEKQSDKIGCHICIIDLQLFQCTQPSGTHIV